MPFYTSDYFYRAFLSALFSVFLIVDLDFTLSFGNLSLSKIFCSPLGRLLDLFAAEALLLVLFLVSSISFVGSEPPL